MNLEICDYFEPITRIKNRTCKYFTGKTDNTDHTGRCDMYCRIMKAKRMMEEGEIMVRRRGALRKK